MPPYVQSHRTLFSPLLALISFAGMLPTITSFIVQQMDSTLADMFSVRSMFPVSAELMRNRQLCKKRGFACD